MTESVLQTRVQFKRDIENNWKKATNFIPLKGEMIIYQADETHNKNRIKIGDGINKVSDLVFSNGNEYISDYYIDSVFKGYVNLIPISTDINGENIYNNQGFKNGYRLSSSGVEKEQSNSCTTGYIKATQNDAIRMTGVEWFKTSGYNYIIVYDQNYNLLETINFCNEGTIPEEGYHYVSQGKLDKNKSRIYQEGNMIRFNIVLKDNLNYNYIRISAYGDGANMIITKNELID